MDPTDCLLKQCVEGNVEKDAMYIKIAKPIACSSHLQVDGVTVSDREASEGPPPA